MDSNVPGLTRVTTILDTDVYYVARLTTGLDCYILGSDLKTSIGAKIPISVNCIDSNITQISMGNFVNFHYAFLDCFMTRNGKARKQSIEIFQIGGVPDVSEGPMRTIPNTEGETLGITFSANNEDGVIYLNIHVDNSEASLVVFTYTILNNG